MSIARRDILDRLRAKIARGEPIIGGGAGTDFRPRPRRPAAST